MTNGTGRLTIEEIFLPHYGRQDAFHLVATTPQKEGYRMALEKGLDKISGLVPTKKAFSLLDEFKAFAFKGNVIDLAVGVIIGVAFGKIIDSLVKHIIMPFISIFMPGEKGYLGWKCVVSGVEIPYGLFIGEIVNFLIVALALFIFIVKFLGWIMKSKKEEAPAPPPPPTREEELLAEIRDLLKK
jgi:large conductance mechanosensitive channel